MDVVFKINKLTITLTLPQSTLPHNNNNIYIKKKKKLKTKYVAL